MKKIIFGILFLTPIFFSSTVIAGTLNTDGTSCNSVNINSSNRDILSVEKEGLPIFLTNNYTNSFSDTGNNQLVLFGGQRISGFFPGRVIPNNTYSYNAWTADGACESVMFRPGSCTPTNRKQSIAVKTYCPPAVSVVGNSVTSEPPAPSINTSQDSDLISLSASGSSNSGVSLAVNVSKLNPGHYTTMTELKEGIAYITYVKTAPLWWEWWKPRNGAVTVSTSFLCFISNCDVDVNSLPFPGDAFAYAGAPYTHSYTYDVYKLSNSPDEIVIPTDATYDLLRNGQEIAKKLPAAQAGFTDTGLVQATSYSYTVRSPSIYSREGVSNIPSAISSNYQPGFYLSSYSGSPSPFAKSPVMLAPAKIKSIIAKTSGIFEPKATIVLDINIPSDAVGEYRTPGYLWNRTVPPYSGWSTSGYWNYNPAPGNMLNLDCISINGSPSSANCASDYVTEKIVTVTSDKTYDILRQENNGLSKEVATKVSISQKSFTDTNLNPGTLYTYTVQAPSIHAREGLSDTSIGTPEQQVQPLPPLASPVQTKVDVITAGKQSPPLDTGGDSGGDSGSGAVLPGFIPGPLKEVRP